MDLRRLRETELRRYLFEEISIAPKNIVLPISLSDKVHVAELFKRILPHYQLGTRALNFYAAEEDCSNFTSIANSLADELRALLGELFIIGQVPTDADLPALLSTSATDSPFDLLIFDPSKHSIPENESSVLLFPLFESEESLSRTLPLKRDQIDGCCVNNLPFRLELITKIADELMLPILAVHSEAYARSLITLEEHTSEGGSIVLNAKRAQLEALIALKRSGATLLSSPLCWRMHNASGSI